MFKNQFYNYLTFTFEIPSLLISSYLFNLLKCIVHVGTKIAMYQGRDNFDCVQIWKYTYFAIMWCLTETPWFTFKLWNIIFLFCFLFFILSHCHDQVLLIFTNAIQACWKKLRKLSFLFFYYIISTVNYCS